MRMTAGSVHLEFDRFVRGAIEIGVSAYDAGSFLSATRSGDDEERKGQGQEGNSLSGHNQRTLRTFDRRIHRILTDVKFWLTRPFTLR